MKAILNGFITALSMYSIVPMPQIEWNKDTMKYAMCFFPLVGIIIGALVWLWTWVCITFGVAPLLFCAVLVLIPVICSGAIHIDGLIDTSDAIYSRQTKERKLEILKDPHVGAFGIIICCGYFILSLGGAAQFYQNPKFLIILCLGYILSRSMSSLSIVSFKTAKNSGLAHVFSDNADKKAVQITSIIYIILTVLAMIFLNVTIGSLVFAICMLWLLLFKRICYKGFGGLTGDLAGFLLCVTELMILFICALAV